MEKQISCPVCKNEVALYSPTFGILPGKRCQERRSKNKLPDKAVEMVGDSIKKERKEYAKSVVQPFASDGTLSKEYLEAHGGPKNIKVTEKDIKKAKYVWGGAISRNTDIKKAK